MKNYSIALLEGDGIGPEIIREGVKVLDAVSDVMGFKLDYERLPYGTEHYLKTGEVLPDSAVKDIKESFKAIYFGAAGDPRVAPGILEVGLILKLRFALDQYINLRPVKLYPNVQSPLKTNEKIDFYVVRENTEDFYNGMGNIFRTNGDKNQVHEAKLNMERALYNAQIDIKAALGTADDFAINMGFMTRQGAERVMRYSFELARAKGKKKVTCVDKENVLPHIYGIWREAFNKVASEYPDIETDHAFVDAITMWFVKNPENYGVVVAPNLFGDIISDLGAGIAGGLGFAAGANINPTGISMFEPIHGSAPKYKGKNVINPVATILSGGIMLDTLGLKTEAKLLDDAVTAVLAEGIVKTKDMGGTSSTSQMGDAIAAKVKELSKNL
jgi:isocitrate/isopropylmalate dehydrogenase